MPYIVKDKIAIITGSAQGIGKEFAKRLLNNGAKVCLSDTNTQIGNETLEELIDIHGKSAVTFKRYISHCLDLDLNDQKTRHYF